MDFRTIGVVISREYSTRVRKKSFLVTTFVVPVLFALMCFVPAIILLVTKDKDQHIAYVDQSGYVSGALTDTKSIFFTDLTLQVDPEELRSRFSELDYDAIMLISPKGDSLLADAAVSIYSSKPVGVEVKEIIASEINDILEQKRLESYNIDQLQQIMDSIKSDVSVATFTIEEDGSEKESSTEVYMIISMVLAMIIFMFVSMFSSMVMQSVIEEKSSKVIEVLVSSVKSIDLMFGKIIGVALVALTQFVLWIVLTVALVGIAGSFFDVKSLFADNPSAKEQITQMAGAGTGIAVEDIASTMAPADSLAAGAEHSEGLAVFETLKNLDYTRLLVCFFLFFLLGYLLYASLFAAIGSAVDNEADTQQLQIPLTVPLMIGFFVGIYAFKFPESSLVWWCSMIPFTSPIVMLARIPFGVPMWEIGLSLGLLVLTFALCAWVGAKIYKVGILMSGKKSTFKDLWHWIKMK